MRYDCTAQQDCGWSKRLLFCAPFFVINIILKPTTCQNVSILQHLRQTGGNDREILPSAIPR